MHTEASTDLDNMLIQIEISAEWKPQSVTNI